jgi:hypothetical protein
MYMSSLFSFRRILLSPKGAEGGGGKKPTPKGDDGGKAAPKGKVEKVAPKVESDDDEDIEDDEEPDETEDDDDLEKDEADEDLDDIDEDDEEDDEKRTHRPKVKDKGREKGVKPKLVSISHKELRELKRKAGEAENAEKLSQKRRDQIAREREEKIAAKDGAKALELARKRMQRTLNEKEVSLEAATAERDKYRDLYVGRAFNEGFDAAVIDTAAEREVRLRPKAMKHIRNSFKDRFEPVEDEEGEISIVEKGSGKHISDVLADLIESDDFEMFRADEGESEATEGETATEVGRKPARVAGAHKRPGGVTPNGKDKGKKPTYASAYKERRRELEENEGVKPGFGLSRPAQK